MKKQKTSIYKCSECGHEEAKWLGRCPECGQWNTLAETLVKVSGSSGRGIKAESGKAVQPVPLSAVDALEGVRISTGISELDRVLGGGIMKHSAVLVGGEPGIGKSTLLLQLAASCKTKGRILYVSGEESSGQIKLRADRLGLAAQADKAAGSINPMDRIEIFCSSQLEDIETVLNNLKPVLVLIDSAQTLYSPNAGAVAGTVNQMKFCSFELISWVKEHDSSVFLTAHVTKEGIISGPKTLEHMVDTVLYFEQQEGHTSNHGIECDFRFLRAAKNRFGSIDEIGIFTMNEKGLSSIDDTGRLFLVRREKDVPSGVAAAAVLEGTRCILAEIQALVIPSKSSISRVFSDKIDSARVSRISAAIEKHLGLRLSDHDLYVNVAGGIKIAEVGVELALACALYSARTGLALPQNLAIAGEVSLTGEVRPVRRLAGRVKTAANLGFTKFLGPREIAAANPSDTNQQPQELPSELIAVNDLKKAIAGVFTFPVNKDIR